MASTTVLIGSDEIQARQRPTHRVQQLGRRNLLGALVASSAALSAAPAIAAEAGQDPHLGWWHGLERVVAELDALDDVPDDVRQRVLEAKWAIEDRIADTPATTLTGLRLQALLGLRYIEEDMPPGDLEPQLEVRALRSIVASLEQLTGTA